MPTPAGTGMNRRGFVARSLGLALTVYGAGRLDVFDQGIAAGRDDAEEPDPRHRLPPGRRRRAVTALAAGRPALPQAAPEPRDLRRHGSSPRTTGSSGIPSLDPIAQLHGEGKVTVLPAVGYDHPDQSHFTSRHFWEVGATDSRLLTGWLGRYLDAVGSPDNPSAGPVADRVARARARDGEGAGRCDRRPRAVRLLCSRRLGRGRRPDARGDRDARATQAVTTLRRGRPRR